MSDSGFDENYRDGAKTEIIRWESEGPGYLAQIGDAILWPAQKAMEAVIPKSVQDSVGRAIESFLSSLDWTARALIDAEELQTRVANLRASVSDDLKGSDQAAKYYWNWNVGYGATTGGAAGAVGLIGLVPDIPALFTVSLRLIQQIGMSYGYDVSTETEQEYVMQILRTGSTGDIKAKVEFLVALKQVEQILLRVAWKKMNEALARKEISKQAALAGIRQFAKSLGIQVTKRKALQTIPIVGALVGASFNATFVNDIGRTAYMTYRRRWIAENEGIDKDSSV